MRIIDFNSTKCRHCYKCVRNCEIKAISVLGGRAEIMEDHCILCGHCLAVCPQEAKTIAEDKLARELRLENRKASMISTAATLSPLLGLFGTVVGLLGAFGTVAAMGEMGDASVLADDIGKALVTTVAGLAVSMPCLFVFGLVKNRLNYFAVLLEEEIAEIVNRLVLKG